MIISQTFKLNVLMKVGEDNIIGIIFAKFNKKIYERYAVYQNKKQWRSHLMAKVHLPILFFKINLFLLLILRKTTLTKF